MPRGCRPSGPNDIVEFSRRDGVGDTGRHDLGVKTKELGFELVETFRDLVGQGTDLILEQAEVDHA